MIMNTNTVGPTVCIYIAISFDVKDCSFERIKIFESKNPVYFLSTRHQKYSYCISDIWLLWFPEVSAQYGGWPMWHVQGWFLWWRHVWNAQWLPCLSLPPYHGPQPVSHCIIKVSTEHLKRRLMLRQMRQSMLHQHCIRNDVSFNKRREFT